jgi:hypothetical protein
MTSPAFELPTDQEELDELRALLGDLEKPAGDPQLDAVASDALRVMQREQEEIDRYSAALKAEISRITDRYTLLAEPHVRYQSAAEQLVLECARRAQFVGKSKSRKVGNGTYGRRTIPERVSVIDDDKAINFLLAKKPSAVMHVSKYKIIGADAKVAVLDHLKATGEIPEGFEHVDAHEVEYAKPLNTEL